MGNIVGRQNCISDFQRQVIIGCLLGDGRLKCRSKSGNARLRTHHGEKQKDYLFWKYRVLKNIVNSKPKEILWKDNKRDIDCISWYFHTLTLRELKGFHLLFYNSKGKKVLPKNLHDLLTPISLAIWTMDDGDNDKDSIRYNTQSFSLKEQKILRKILREKYQLQVNLNKDRNSYRLRVNKVSKMRLIKLISPFIIPSMKYKILSP